MGGALSGQGIEQHTRQRRSHPFYYYVVLAVIFLIASYARFRLPPWPFGDPDTPGYLQPAISKLAEDVFKHTDGRNFIYPGFLLLVLISTHTLAAISFVQHALGLATGALMLSCWNRTRRFVRHLSWQMHELFGLIIVGIYLLARQSIGSEHELRPEAIAPFFALLNILFTIIFFEDRDRRGLSWAGAWVGGAILINSVILVSLRSAFAISVLFSVIPVLVALFHRRETWLRAALVVSAALTTAAAIMLTEHSLARGDVAARMFLPATLFTIHANLIARQMDEDIAHRNCGPTGCAWLSEVNGSLHQEIEKSRQSGTVYSSLGFDPDYLMYEDSLRLWRNRFFGGNYDEQFNFYLRYYLHTARSHPEWLVRKIIRQMALFYLGHKHIFITSPRAELGTRYAQTVDSLRALASSTPSYAPLSVYIKQCKKLSPSQEVISQPLVVRALGALLSIVYPLVFFATIAAALLSKGGLRGFHGRFAIVTLFVFSYNFGNCLLTSIVHSLSLTRYVVSQFSFGLLSECIALVFLFEVFATWRTSHLRGSTLT